MALSAYRHLLRATRIAFQDDFHLLHAARTQARTGFDSLRSLDSGSEEATKGIQHAEGVAEILRQNVVQAKRVEGSDVLRMEVPSTIVSTSRAADSRGRIKHTQGHGTRRQRHSQEPSRQEREGQDPRRLTADQGPTQMPLYNDMTPLELAFYDQELGSPRTRSS